MSDDLIRRKAAYEAFSVYLKKNFLGEISAQSELSIGEIASVIKSIPTACDKQYCYNCAKKLEMEGECKDAEKRDNQT